jgi:hypothetical protein
MSGMGNLFVQVREVLIEGKQLGKGLDGLSLRVLYKLAEQPIDRRLDVFTVVVGAILPTLLL